ncbi:MAG: DNA polymerase III subunit beta [Planctomycetes bacterium]|nr:DNA polymerase III subunit beta [Planctomycetota bacterium]
MPITQAQIDKIVSLAKSYGATRLILFGSSIDTPAQARDVDIACDGITGWKLYELAARLEEELHTPLDLIPLSPPSRFTKRIESKGRIIL